jgi:hypothetical protein
MLILEIAFGVAVGLALFVLFLYFWRGLFNALLFLVAVLSTIIIVWLSYLFWGLASVLLTGFGFACVIFFAIYSDKKEVRKADVLLDWNSESGLDGHINSLFEVLEKILIEKFSDIEDSTVLLEYEDKNFKCKVEVIKFPFRAIDKNDLYVTIQNKSDKNILLNRMVLNYAADVKPNWMLKSQAVTDTRFHKSKDSFEVFVEFIKAVNLELIRKFI